MSNNLKPCPFCYGPAKEENGFIGCCDPKCGNYMGIYTETEWSNRSPMRVKLPGRVEAKEGVYDGEIVHVSDPGGYYLVFDEVVAALKRQGVEVGP